MLNTPCPKPLRIAGTVQDSIVDGPGLRYVIFTQGCPHHCPGCHNPQTHDFQGGKDADTDQILEQIFDNPLTSGVTFSGGEPFVQADALVPLAEVRLLELADILVDGPYIEEQRDLTLQYRGSANQRVIDLNKSRERGEIILYRSEYEDLW